MSMNQLIVYLLKKHNSDSEDTNMWVSNDSRTEKCTIAVFDKKNIEAKSLYM